MYFFFIFIFFYWQMIKNDYFSFFLKNSFEIFVCASKNPCDLHWLIFCAVRWASWLSYSLQHSVATCIMRAFIIIWQSQTKNKKVGGCDSQYFVLSFFTLKISVRHLLSTEPQSPVLVAVSQQVDHESIEESRVCVPGRMFLLTTVKRDSCKGTNSLLHLLLLPEYTRVPNK